MNLESPESVGMSGERLARVDAFMRERYVEAGRLPFTILQVARAGRLVHRSAIGTASLETGCPAVDDTIVRIYSMTKPITSVAFMMLVEEGLVALDDPVERYLPAWRDLGVYVSGLPGAFKTTRPAEPMRILDLLRHTSGLTYGFQTRTAVDAAYRSSNVDLFQPTRDLTGMIEGLGALPLEFSPGTAWNYSISTDVVGHLIGQLAGLPFDEFIRRRILGPLNMVDTDFRVAPEKVGRLAGCYTAGSDGTLKSLPGPSFLEPPLAPSGGAGLVSTASDYMRFCEMLRRGGELDGTRLIGPKTLGLMLANHLPQGRDLADVSVSMFSEASYRGVGFGLGFAVTTDVARTGVAGSPGEFWWGGLASTSFWVDPVEDLCVVFLTQLAPSSLYPLRRQLRTLINAAVVDSKA